MVAKRTDREDWVPMISASRDQDQITDIANLPDGWEASIPDAGDAPELTELLRREEQRGRGWASSSETERTFAKAASAGPAADESAWLPSEAACGARPVIPRARQAFLRRARAALILPQVGRAARKGGADA